MLLKSFGGRNEGMFLFALYSINQYHPLLWPRSVMTMYIFSVMFNTAECSLLRCRTGTIQLLSDFEIPNSFIIFDVLWNDLRSFLRVMAWPSDSGARFEDWWSQVQVALWPPATFDPRWSMVQLHSYSLVHSQLACLLPVGIQVNLLSLFHWP